MLILKLILVILLLTALSVLAWRYSLISWVWAGVSWTGRYIWGWISWAPYQLWILGAFGGWVYKNRRRLRRVRRRGITAMALFLIWQMGMASFIARQVWKVPFFVWMIVLILVFLLIGYSQYSAMMLSPRERRRNLAITLSVAVMVLGGAGLSHKVFEKVWAYQLVLEAEAVRQQTDSFRAQSCANQTYRNGDLTYKTNEKCDLEWQINKQGMKFHIVPADRFADELPKASIPENMVTDASDPQRGGLMIKRFEKFLASHKRMREQEIKAAEQLPERRAKRMPQAATMALQDLKMKFHL